MGSLIEQMKQKVEKEFIQLFEKQRVELDKKLTEQWNKENAIREEELAVLETVEDKLDLIIEKLEKGAK